MGTKKKFTPEELKHLQANPYTLRVTANSISYTLAFKEAFWALSLQGYTGTAAFRKLGYNTEVLGFERIHNTTKRIRREARSPEGFHEGARGSVRMEMSRNVQSGNTQNLKSMVIQRSFPKWSVAERRKTAAASDQAAVCACAHSRYFAGGSPSGLRV